MQLYTNEQPTILKAILDNRKEIVGSFADLLLHSEIDRVVLIGSGSSYHAGLMAKPLIEKAINVEVTPIVPTRMDELANMASKHVLYLAISQGGRSTNTNQVVSKLHQKGNIVIAITEYMNSPITKQADLSLYLPISKEDIGAKTKGVSATVLIIMLAFLELGMVRGIVSKSFYDETIQSAYRLTDQMEENINRAISWSKTIIPIISPLSTFNVIAKGNAYGAALEGRLKMLETIWKSVSYFEFEEYLHGPENALDKNTCGLLLISNDSDAERMLRLGDYATSKGAHFFSIDLNNNSKEVEKLSLMTVGSTYLTCFEYLPVLQTLSAQLSSFYEIDLTRSKYPDFIKLMGTKLQ